MDPSRIGELERRIGRLEALLRGMSLALAGSLAAVFLFAIAPPALNADKKEEPKDLQARSLLLQGDGGSRVKLAAVRFQQTETIDADGLAISDADGNLRARFSWIKLPPGAVPRAPVTSFGLYNGERNVIQSFPLD